MNATRMCTVILLEESVPVHICHWGLLGIYTLVGNTLSVSPIAQWSERCTYEVTLNARVPSSILGGTTIFSFPHNSPF